MHNKKHDPFPNRALVKSSINYYFNGALATKPPFFKGRFGGNVDISGDEIVGYSKQKRHNLAIKIVP